MKTKLIDTVQAAADILKSGGLVAFPTETVFGLGVDARNRDAVRRLFTAKGRPADNPLIVHLSDIHLWPMAAREMTTVGQRVLELFAPGPATVVLPKRAAICELVTAGLDSVGIRIPAAEVARELLRLAEIPIAAPSANRSGRPSGTTWQSVVEDLDGRIDAVLCLDVPHVGLESSVIDCLGDAPVLLRPGAIGFSDLLVHFPNARQWESEPTSGRIMQASMVSSPGLNHPHYQPRAQVVLLQNMSDADISHWKPHASERGLKFGYAGLSACPLGMVVSQQFPTLEEYARGFYEFLRRADRVGADVVLIEAVPIATASRMGVAAALLDRQRRAAGNAQD